MAPKGGGGGGGFGFGSKSGSRESPDPSKVPITTSGGNLAHETSNLMMCMVVLPALCYLLDDGRMTEVVRWVVGKIVGAGHRQALDVETREKEGGGVVGCEREVGDVVEDEEGGVEGCDGKKGGDTAMDEKGCFIGRLEGTKD